MGGETDRIGAAEAASMLGWWLEAGVDTPVQEQPRNWLKAESASAIQTSSETASPATALQIPETLDLFRDWLGKAATLPVATGSGRRVLPRGAENAPIMLLTDAPTSEEAAAGQPIAGEAWELTERMLAAIGIRADDAYLANISCFHAPGARMSAEDLDVCAAIARRHIALAKPQRLLLLGDAPARALFGKTVAAARGHVHKIEGVRAVATFHPRFLLNQPSSKSLAWKDLLLLMEDSR